MNTETRELDMHAETAPKPALPLLLLLALASALGIAVAIALAGIAMLLAAPAYAGEGSLVLQRTSASIEAQRVFSEADTRADGPIIRTRVVEIFRNTLEERVAATYLYRLPPDALVERFTVAVRAEEDAEEIEEESLEASELQPALLRSGPTLAERSVEVGPGEAVLVELEYRQVLRYDRSRATYRWPS
jgi:hypothetical protein